MDVNTNGHDTGIVEATAIGKALRAAIPVARQLGWTSERTYYEAEAYALSPSGMSDAARARLRTVSATPIAATTRTAAIANASR
jgi:hypothetical protein